MKKISLILAVSLIISIALSGCTQKQANNTQSKPQQNTSTVADNTQSKPQQNTSTVTDNTQNNGQQSTSKVTKLNTEEQQPNALTFNFVTETYVNKNTKIDYPQINGYSDLNKQKQINDLIKNDILNDYQNDIANLVKVYYKTSKEAEAALTENVNYYIKLNSTKLLSILYVKNGSIPGSAHPDTSVHTVNIDIKNGTILKFKDLINVDNSFIEKYRNINDAMWMVTTLPGVASTAEINKELKETIDQNLKMLPNDYLINEFNSDNFNFYFTKDNFGMISDVSHALGDYAEVEIKYNNIKDNTRSGNMVWGYLANTQQ